RAAFVVHDRAELEAELRALAQAKPSARSNVGEVATGGKLALLFSGQGSQRAGMGHALYQSYPAFRDAFEAVCNEIDPLLERPLQSVLFAPSDSPEAALLDQTLFTQTALFALQVALFRLLESWGIKPDLLLGHSIGELSAAHVAGVLSLRDASQL